jgi:predicted Zn-dependent peptidase
MKYSTLKWYMKRQECHSERAERRAEESGQAANNPDFSTMFAPLTSVEMTNGLLTNFLKSKFIWAVLFIFILAFIVASPASAQNMADFEKKITEFTLDNGLKFIVLERHEVPVVSFHTLANVGAVNEVTGKTGLAHLFEHMAFKGTKTIGTKHYKAEAAAMALEDKLFEHIKTELQKGDKADIKHFEELLKLFEQAQNKAHEYIIPDEFEETFAKQGANNFNAYTSYDYTCYTVSLPSNEIELWMSMESDRFANPVLREFYKEQSVVLEERRMRENDPVSRLYEEFCAVAFLAHPYGTPVIGHLSDIQALTRPEAMAFFKKYYIPSNLTVAIVGDVNSRQIETMAKKYFAGIPSSPKTGPIITQEPAQRGERRVKIYDQAQPQLFIGYHQTSMNDPNSAVFKVLDRIVGTGRTSWLYKSLVKEKKIAISANTSISADNGWRKYPGLFIFWTVPARGHTTKECEEAIYAEIEKLKTVPVTQDELTKAKTQIRAELVRMLESNSDTAEELALYDVINGSWRNLFSELSQIQKVTADDVKRVASEYFTNKNRSVGVIATEKTEDASKADTKN